VAKPVVVDSQGLGYTGVVPTVSGVCLRIT